MRRVARFLPGAAFPIAPTHTPQEVAELRRGSANFLAQRGQHARVVALLDSVRSRLSEVSFFPIAPRFLFCGRFFLYFFS